MPKKPIIEEPKRNFLVVELGDNDFSYRMQSALEELRDYWASEGNIQHHCAYSIKNFIVAHVVSYDWKKRCLDRHSSGYFAGIFSAFITVAALISNALAWASYILYLFFS